MIVKWVLFSYKYLKPIIIFIINMNDIETFEKFDKVIITHTCRTIKELQYSKDVINDALSDEMISEFISHKLIYYHSTTREDYLNKGRITDLITSYKLFKDLKIEKINLSDRIMICGSMGLNNDLKDILINLNLNEGANNNPAEFVLEKAFVG